MEALSPGRDWWRDRLGQPQERPGDALEAGDEAVQLGAVERDRDPALAGCRRPCRLGGPVEPAGAAIGPQGDLGQPSVGVEGLAHAALLRGRAAGGEATPGGEGEGVLLVLGADLAPLSLARAQRANRSGSRRPRPPSWTIARKPRSSSTFLALRYLCTHQPGITPAAAIALAETAKVSF